MSNQLSGQVDNMRTHRFYVRGHGGEEGQKLPPSEDLPIDLISLGDFGSTMSDEVADAYIFGRVTLDEIKAQIKNREVIYWTQRERDDWYKTGKLGDWLSPKVSIDPYNVLKLNLALDGDDRIGKCGVFYWNEGKGELEWRIQVGDRKTILLAEILEYLQGFDRSEEDVIQLFWTACMSAKYWSGSTRKVSFNPTKKK